MSTAVILAGGMSRRMRRDKLELQIGGETLLESAVRRFSACFDTVYVSVADIEKNRGLRAGLVEDIYKGCGPMAGLHAALEKSGDEGVFLVAADMPFADPRAAKKIIALTGDSDIGALRGEKGAYEPLFAYYRRTMLPYAEALLKSGSYKMAALMEKGRVRVIESRELGGLWTEKLLYNINYPEEYEKIKDIQS